ncbi:MAG: hypothetical protein V1720_07435 [bacterium]
MTDNSSVTVPDGNYNFTFRLYDSENGGTPLWEEAQMTAVLNGVFNTVLGSVVPITLPFDQQYYLGISVSAGAELKPRVQLTSSAYSFISKTVEDGAITTEKIQDGSVTPEKLSPAVNMGGLVNYTAIVVNCAADDFSTSFSKLTDIGTFDKIEDNSAIFVTLNARFIALAIWSSGLIFELRIDDMQTPYGLAQVCVPFQEEGKQVPGSIRTLFTGLPSGIHTVSIWMRGPGGGGEDAGIDPGCWGTDHCVVEEYRY